ncbi:MAG: hypothetical protein IJP10_05915 [Clostridia bacterium]|nr:hypothetical protein [Oscillospiraceae bacterium]MBQ6797535.1 hypothetical protein [Clostridia bacterium]
MSDTKNDIRSLENSRRAREKELLDELEYRDSVKKLSLRKNRPILIKFALALVDLILIGIVIYGNSHYVYAGFPKFIPWLIAGLFAVMFVIRIVSALRELSASSENEK